MRQRGAWVTDRTWLLGALMVLVGGTLWAEESPQASPSIKPPWQRLLQGEDARKAAEQEKCLNELQAAGQFEQALKVAEGLAELRQKVQGRDHWETANARSRVEVLRCLLGQEKDRRQEYAGVFALMAQANALQQKARYSEAQPLLEKVLALNRKVLGEEHPDTAASYNNLAVNLHAQGKYAEAGPLYRRALAIRSEVLGEEHPATAASCNNVAMNLNAQGQYAQAQPLYEKALAMRRQVLGEEHPATAASYNNVAFNLEAQGKCAEAQPLYEKALAIRRKVLGEEHPETAQSYNNVAFNLNAQGKYAAAQPLYEKALAMRRKMLGEEHRYTAASYNNMAANLNAQGKYAAAQPLYEKALAIRRKVLGEEHRYTAASYNNVAANLKAQGKYAAAQPLYEKALATRRKVLGEEHPATATSYNNVAYNLNAQGKYAAAQPLNEKALTIRRKVLGEEHPDTAQSYNNLAFNLEAQGKYAAARPLFEKALAIHGQVLGEDHPDTARSYNNVAANLNAQGKYAAAQPLYEKALAIYCQVLGEEHRYTAVSYNNMAANLEAQGKYAAAQPLYEKALAIRRKVLGEEHPATAASYSNVAFNLEAQGQYAAAEDSLRAAAKIFARARPRLAASGLERATKTSEHSPLPRLAAVLARNGKFDEAWQRFEESLARGTWDDLTARLHRSPAEQAQQAQLVARLDRLDHLIEKIVAIREPTHEQDEHRKQLLTERRQAQDELDDFEALMTKTHGPADGQVFVRKDIQAALPKDTALLGWLDLAGARKAKDPNGEHWAVLLRSTGEAIWVPLPRSGPENTWTEADTRLPSQLRTALHSPRSDWQPLARRLRQQRLEPLARHLAANGDLPAVRHLIVFPSTALAGIPVEVFADGYTISYALSGTLYTHLRQQPKPISAGLLAVADPVFDLPGASDKPAPLPPGGVLLTLVTPSSNAAQSGLKPNDVLLRYGDTDLTGPADLKVKPTSEDPTERVPIKVWRAGQVFQRQVRPGKLGLVLAAQPAPQAIAEQRKLDQRLAAASRGGGEEWPPLPGTRLEAEALRRLFGGPAEAKMLLDSQASEQRLDDLARDGSLGKYRYLHLATHGEFEDRFPLRSAVILSRDALPDADRQLEAGLPVYDGRLTAEEVLRRQWRLGSELVTLSACETALGKYARGEGHIGFAHALLLAGSRSVCLSQWKVNDATTALFMERFYQNLLGKREGLKEPLGKAAALAEAREWLRTLPRQEALRRVAQLSKGVERGKGRPALPPPPEVAAISAGQASTEDRPYAHPYYWAAFVLVGNPD
jgi:CHAT domain-containing protein/tetratricopeptide (TPR) repeat protein